MSDAAVATQRWSDFNTQRRALLFGALGATATAFSVPWALSRSADALGTTFVPVSSYLLGRQVLDVGLAGRLHAALVDVFPEFPSTLQSLAELIAREPVEPLYLQALLDTAHPALAPWPRRIARAWAVGVVGDGKNARCVAYESALNAVIVADVLKPPTYAYGGYGSWSSPSLPLQENMHG
jgi:hypothetical protein